jgi:membrane protease YdiL (CAAX protease family)
MDNIPSKKIIWAQIFLIFVLPVLLLYFKIVPTNWRMILLALSSLFIYGVVRHEHWTYRDMGVRHDNFKKALPFYLLFTFLGLVALFLIYYKVSMPREIYNELFYMRTFVFFLPSSFFQEFAFRSFLMPRLKIIFNNNYYVIFVDAILFTLMHIIYFSLGIVLPLVFVAGVFLSWLYSKYPNLVLISLAHSALNLTAVLLGFFVIS